METLQFFAPAIAGGIMSGLAYLVGRGSGRRLERERCADIARNTMELTGNIPGDYARSEIIARRIEGGE